MRVILVLILLTFAGCAGSTDAPDEGLEGTRESPSAPRSETGGSSNTSAASTRLVDVSPGTLATKSAEVTVAAGQYGIVRWIMTPGFYDGDASSGSFSWAWAVRGPDDGLVMEAQGRVSAFDSSSPVEPSFEFILTSDTWRGRVSSYSCSGCDAPPRNQWAILFGSPEGNVTFRFGIGTYDGDALWDRDAVAVALDGNTTEAWGGESSYAYEAAGPRESVEGVLAVERNGLGPAPARGTRSTTFGFEEATPRKGLFSLDYYANEATGADAWNFSVSGAAQASTSGRYVHGGPAAGYQTIAPAAQAPQATIQVPVQPGALTMTGARDFMGMEGPTEVPFVGSREYLNVGYAGIDLGALYGWDIEAVTPPGPISGFTDTIQVAGPA